MEHGDLGKITSLSYSSTPYAYTKAFNKGNFQETHITYIELDECTTTNEIEPQIERSEASIPLHPNI